MPNLLGLLLPRGDHGLSNRPGTVGVRARSLTAALVLALAGGVLNLATPVAVLGADGYQLSAATSYTVLPEAARLDVSISLVIKNTTPSSGNLTYYFNSAVVGLESTATNIRASADSGSASSSLYKKGSSGFDLWRINFSSSIFYGATRRLTVTYQVPSGPPRSGSGTRVGRAYSSFCVVSNGVDSGTVSIAAPASFSFTWFGAGGDLASTTANGTTTWTTANLSKPEDFWACFSGTDPSGYATTSVTSPSGRPVNIQFWPEDPSWQDQVKAQISSSLSALEKLVGRPIPGSGAITVEEVSSASLGYYAGQFDSQQSIAYLSEDIETGVVPHELAHAWFNRSLFLDTWLSEGSAGWAESTVTGVACGDPGPPPGGVSPDISSWRRLGPRSTTIDLQVSAWQYKASCYVVTMLFARAGSDKVQPILGSLLDGLIAYQSKGSAYKRTSGTATWREWLDAVDELGIAPAGGSLDGAQGLLKSMGAPTVTDGSLLTSRSDARTMYHKLVDSLGEWAVPEVILRAMAEWRFPSATTAMTSANATRLAVNNAAAALPEANPLTGPVKPLFEGAKSQDDLAAAEKKAGDQLAAAMRVASVKARLAAPRPDVVKLGLAGTDLSAKLADAVAAVAAADLPSTEARTTEIDASLDNETAAAAAVAGAKDRVDAPRDVLTTIGLIGSDLDARVASGIAAVSAVDPDQAKAVVAGIDDVLAGASGAGILRIAVVVGVILLIALAIFLWRRRGRGRRLAAAVAPAAPSAGPGQAVSGAPPLPGEPAMVPSPETIVAAPVVPIESPVAPAPTPIDPAPAPPPTPIDPAPAPPPAPIDPAPPPAAAPIDPETPLVSSLGPPNVPPAPSLPVRSGPSTPEGVAVAEGVAVGAEPTHAT